MMQPRQASERSREPTMQPRQATELTRESTIQPRRQATELTRDPNLFAELLPARTSSLDSTSADQVHETVIRNASDDEANVASRKAFDDARDVQLDVIVRGSATMSRTDSKSRRAWTRLRVKENVIRAISEQILIRRDSDILLRRRQSPIIGAASSVPQDGQKRAGRWALDATERPAARKSELNGAIDWTRDYIKTKYVADMHRPRHRVAAERIWAERQFRMATVSRDCSESLHGASPKDQSSEDGVGVKFTIPAQANSTAKARCIRRKPVHPQAATEETQDGQLATWLLDCEALASPTMPPKPRLSALRVIHQTSYFSAPSSSNNDDEDDNESLTSCTDCDDYATVQYSKPFSEPIRTRWSELVTEVSEALEPDGLSKDSSTSGTSGTSGTSSSRFHSIDDLLHSTEIGPALQM